MQHDIDDPATGLDTSPASRRLDRTPRTLGVLSGFVLAFAVGVGEDRAYTGSSSAFLLHLFLLAAAVLLAVSAVALAVRNRVRG